MGGPFLIGLYVLAAGLVLFLLVARRHRRRAGITAVAVLLAVAAGWLLAWMVSDVWDVFGVSLSPVTRAWVALFFGGLALATSSLPRTSWWRKAVGIVAVPVFLLTAAAGINADFGEFTTLRDALGISRFQPLDMSPATGADASLGTVGTVTIPATVSGFDARPALVYLPPAARVAHPPVLPIIEVFSGQPGAPEDLFVSGHIDSVLDAYAASHQGLAPIVVVPDQLGAADRNPMCVDSALGNSATYLTVDVPNWIRSNLSVASAPGGWAIAGFSEGGTCSIQLGAANPNLYGTILNISGEIVPKVGSPATTIQAGFGGSTAAYAAAAPAAILAAHAPYADLSVIFAVGGDDAQYLSWAGTLRDAARQAGATTRLIVSPGTAHDWYTVNYAWKTALPLMLHRLGLAGS
ncbi:hypothetical protein JF66_07660 [Cryobacterium sp. MLB-32]|nr:hypothetical protein JF66_07660 [Cryobacterium sp. MLB-32]